MIKKFIENLKDKISSFKKGFSIISSEGWYFDSSKADKIISYASFNSIRELYLTHSGKWIEVIDREVAIELTEREVKNIFIKLNRLKLYERYFGKMREI